MDALSCNSCGGLMVSDTGGDYICPHCGTTLSAMSGVVPQRGARYDKIYHDRSHSASVRNNRYLYENDDAWQANAIRIMEDGGG